ncbi:MAG: hypothetical protein ACXVH0_00260, partial [Thermoanaerobaculia bacterium]
MQPIRYNDLDFTVEKADRSWDIRCTRTDGSVATAGTGLFVGLGEEEARARALVLIRTVFPVGVKSVGPDVAHPNTIGDLKIVG